MEFLSAEFLSALFAIIVIDLMLAGDNAIVIALAARNVPAHLQKRAILWGMAGAVTMRILMTLIVVWLLKIPGLLGIGGALLVWIAYRLLEPNGHDSGCEHAGGANTFWGAMRTIVIALGSCLGIATSRAYWSRPVSPQASSDASSDSTTS